MVSIRERGSPLMWERSCSTVMFREASLSKPGMYSDALLSGLRRPSSISNWTAAPVTGLVIERMLKVEFFSIGTSFSRSFQPTTSWSTILRFLITKSSAPTISSSSK